MKKYIKIIIFIKKNLLIKIYYYIYYMFYLYFAFQPKKLNFKLQIIIYNYKLLYYK